MVSQFAACAVLLALLACGGEGGRSRAGETAAPATPAPSERNSGVGALTPENAGGVDANGELLLDDLSDGDAKFSAAGISGEWFTYSDGTAAVTPPDHTGLLVNGGETHVSGQGFSDWGVGLSAYLRSADLTRFCSLKLTARGSGTIVLEVATPATSPASEGGTCEGNGCFGHFATSLQLAAEYQEFTIEFARLVQPSWAQPAQLSLAGVISFNFVSKVAGAPAAIDLWVDRLALQSCG
jgi:hypothetical protein